MSIFRAAALFLALATACVVAPAAPAAPAPVTTVRVDVWHDTVCPWCRIGLHNLDAALDGFTAARVEVVHHAFLLDPDAPAGGTDMREHLAQKVGADRLDSMLARVSQAGAPYGVRFNWDAVKTLPNTTASHALIEWAPPARRPAVIAAIQRAHFEDGRNIGDADAARAAVTDPARLAAVRAAAEGAARRGISGVPHYEIGGRALDGAQSPETLRAALEAAARG
jgi:predicted DsbA family dithiol-disulfide isomerase